MRHFEQRLRFILRDLCRRGNSDIYLFFLFRNAFRFQLFTRIVLALRSVALGIEVERRHHDFIVRSPVSERHMKALRQGDKNISVLAALVLFHEYVRDIITVSRVLAL